MAAICQPSVEASAYASQQLNTNSILGCYTINKPLHNVIAHTMCWPLLVQVAAMGRLALIADELGQTATAAAIRGRMKAALGPWLAGNNTDPLRHDTVWGGICSAGGLADGGLPGRTFSYFHPITFSESFLIFLSYVSQNADA